MKKIYAAIAIIATLSATIATHINAVESIYIRNNYGSTVACKIEWDPSRKPEFVEEGEARIANGETIKIGTLNTFTAWQPNVVIRTTGVGSGFGLSPYTSIKPYIEQIIRENSSLPKAIITINQGSYINPLWSINVTYERY